MSAKYACIAGHADTFAITLMCRVLGVSATGYHAARRRPPSARAQTDEGLLVTIAERPANAAATACWLGPLSV